MASARPKKRRTAATKRSRKRKRGKKPKQPSRKRKPAKKKRSPAKKTPKLKKHKLIAPRKGPPPKPAKIPDVREIMRQRREEQREEPTFPDRDDRWKTIDPFEDFERSPAGADYDRYGGVLDEDEDAPVIDPDGDPDALPGFEPFKDLPPGVDVHDYIAWLGEEYDLDLGELYELYFGDGES